MSLSDFAAIGSLISSVAVVVSLIYLALQIRQAERNQRAALNQGAIDRVSSMLSTFAHPDFARIFAKSYDPTATFSDEEIATLLYMQRTQLLSLQDAMVHHREGLVDEITLDNSRTALRQQFSQPVWRAAWLLSQHSYAEELRTEVNAIVAQSPITPVANFGGAFNAMVAQQREGQPTGDGRPPVANAPPAAHPNP